MLLAAIVVFVVVDLIGLGWWLRQSMRAAGERAARLRLPELPDEAPSEPAEGPPAD